MSISDRPHITAFAIFSVDGRVLPPGEEDLARQTTAMGEFDAVALDGCSVGEAIPALSVWLKPGSASAAAVEKAGNAPGRAVIFSSRLVQTALPPHVEVLRAGADVGCRLRRLRRDFQTRRLLCPLGCRITPELIVHDLVDELRLTMRSRIVGGRKFPTLSGLPDAGLPQSTRWSLRQLVREEDGCGLIYCRI